MGGISSRLTRQFYRFNAENRAHKIIAKNELRPAPKHEKTLKEIKQLNEEMPTLKDDLAKFDPKLHDRLKQVYVVSTDVMPKENISRTLTPLSHKVRRTTDFGFDDDETAPEGRITLKHVIQMIMTYTRQDDCKIEDLAKEYRISQTDAENIVKYYQCFTLKLPYEGYDQKKYLNTLLFGNEEGEVLLADQFIQRLEERKGVQKGLTKDIPLLAKELETFDAAEEEKQPLISGSKKLLPKPIIPKKAKKGSENQD